MFLDDGVDHNCLTKNMRVYVRRPSKNCRINSFFKNDSKNLSFMLFYRKRLEWTDFHISWREYTSNTFRLRLKQFIKAAS